MVILLGFLLGLAIIGITGLILGFPIMWLWNWLMPMLFGIPTITFWQALGLYLLCSVLFKNSTSSSK
jgi:hypothetical protein